MSKESNNKDESSKQGDAAYQSLGAIWEEENDDDSRGSTGAVFGVPKEKKHDCCSATATPATTLTQTTAMGSERSSAGDRSPLRGGARRGGGLGANIRRAISIQVQTAQKNRRIRSVLQDARQAEQIDLAFVVDLTGSMLEHVDRVKNRIREIADRTTATNPDLKLRLAFVGYRGLNDGEKGFDVLDFTSSVSRFRSFVGNLKTWGGDNPLADIAGGVYRANQLSWRQPTRLVYVVGDYPCHGVEYHSEFHSRRHRDEFPEGNPKISIFGEFQDLQSKTAVGGTMTLFFGRITRHTDKMVQTLQQKGIRLEEVEFGTNGRKVSALVTSALRTSAFKTMSLSASSRNSKLVGFGANIKGDEKTKSKVSLKDYKIQATPTPSKISPDWNGCPYFPVKLYESSPIVSLDELQQTQGSYSSGSVNTTTSNIDIRVQEHPFAEGGIRLAYHGQIAPQPGMSVSHTTPVILKCFKHQGGSVNHLAQYLKQMEVSNIAAFLAEEYNAMRCPSRCRPIRFLRASVVETTRKTTDEVDDSKEQPATLCDDDQEAMRFCMEDPLPPEGNFRKFCNNTGHWDDTCLDETLLLFSEFTYTASSGFLMVVDLQGVELENEFCLTDPVILCRDVLRFGHTNLGPTMMKKCLAATRAHLQEIQLNDILGVGM